MFVRLETDEGCTWGEASLHGSVEAVEAAVQELPAPSSVTIPRASRGTGTGCTTPGAGAGRSSRRPSRARLRPCGTSRASASASSSTACSAGHSAPSPRLASHWLQGARTPEQVAPGPARGRAPRFQRLRVTLPGRRPAPGRGRRHRPRRADGAAREAAGDGVEIAVECAEYFTQRTAVRAARALAPYHPCGSRSPCRSRTPRRCGPPEARAVRAAGHRRAPLFQVGGKRADRGGRADVLQPDLIHAGGITEVEDRRLADTYYLPIAPTTRPAPSPTALRPPRGEHPQLLHPGGDRARDRDPRRHLHAPPEARGWCLPLPTEPGIGTDLRFAVPSRGRRSTASSHSLRHPTGPSRRATERPTDAWGRRRQVPVDPLEVTRPRHRAPGCRRPGRPLGSSRAPASDVLGDAPAAGAGLNDDRRRKSSARDRAAWLRPGRCASPPMPAIPAPGRA